MNKYGKRKKRLHTLKRKPHTEVSVFCDPSVCDNCIYIGEGDFICDKSQAIVVSDWEPTDDYMACRKKKGIKP